MRLLPVAELERLLDKARDGTLDVDAEDRCHCPGCTFARLPPMAIRIRRRYRELYPYLFDQDGRVLRSLPRPPR